MKPVDIELGRVLGEHRCVFDPIEFARAYEACRILASPAEAERPALTGVHVELYPDGARLVATDSYALITTWVRYRRNRSAIDAFTPSDPPALDMLPDASFTMLDPSNVLAQVAKHARREAMTLVKVRAPEIPELVLRTGRRASDQGSFEGMQARTATLQFGSEMTGTADLFDGDYPAWRSLAKERQGPAGGPLHLNADLLNRVSTAAGMVGTVMRLEIGSKTAPVRWVIDPEVLEFGSDEIVSKPGAVIVMMPVRRS